jgi:hypothetical protein
VVEPAAARVSRNVRAFTHVYIYLNIVFGDLISLNNQYLLC